MAARIATHELIRKSSLGPSPGLLPIFISPSYPSFPSFELNAYISCCYRVESFFLSLPKPVTCPFFGKVDEYFSFRTSSPPAQKLGLESFLALNFEFRHGRPKFPNVFQFLFLSTLIAGLCKKESSCNKLSSQGGEVEKSNRVAA